METLLEQKAFPAHKFQAFKTGVIALAEGIAVGTGRSFSMFKNYHIDGTKEMIAIGMMNIAGSCTSCYLTTGHFPDQQLTTMQDARWQCQTLSWQLRLCSHCCSSLLCSITLPWLFCVLSAIIIAAMLGLIDYEAAILLSKVVYRNVEQYPNASNVPGILILEIDAPIYFANTNYLRERITRWINDEEDGTKSAGESSLQYVILDMTAVGNIDTSGISMFEVVKKLVDRRGLQLVLANPGSEVMKKMNKSELIENTFQEWIYLTVAEAAAACNLMLHSTKPNPGKDQEPAAWNNVDGFGWLQCEFMYQKPIST
ncbi:unnamed protein product [Prunus armeniaca]